jgi:hypothetical protein
MTSMGASARDLIRCSAGETARKCWRSAIESAVGITQGGETGYCDAFAAVDVESRPTSAMAPSRLLYEGPLPLQSLPDGFAASM